MMNSISRYRLRSNAFERPEEANPQEPKRVVFLSVEGANTERQYFEHLGTRIKDSGSTVFRVEVLKRKRGDGHSAPEYVIELLDEYIETREGGVLPQPWMERLEKKYSPEVIGQLIGSPEAVLPAIKSAIEDELLNEGIDLEYRKYLKSVGSKAGNDIFAAVIDRDGGEGGRSRRAIEICIDESNKKEYRLYLTNPCFEFWLLLHLCDVKVEYADKLVELLENKVLSNRHTFVSKAVSDRAHHGKSRIGADKFAQEYLPNIPTAIERSRDFATELEDILDDLGTNLAELLSELGF